MNPAENEEQVTCDYLIVGAGTACLSFVDSLLTELPDVTFIIVDRNSAAGGHWTKAYPFVRLHQQSCNYGVNSLHLGKLEKDGKELYDMSDRATGKELCEYYEKVVENFKATGRVRTYFNANYEGEVDSTCYDSATTKTITHAITQNEQNIHVECTKIVQCESNVVVPSMRNGVPFPIDESVVKTIPLNELPNHVVGRQQSSSQEQELKVADQKYIVIGAGKSGVDAITYLLEEGNVHSDQITWVVSRSVWYFMRDGIVPNPKPGTKYWKRVTKCFTDPLLEGNSADEAFLNMERAGTIQRVDPNDEGDFPRVFKGPTIMYSELAHLRSLKNIVKKMGRVMSITSSNIILEKGSIPFSPSDTLVVDCMADKLFGYYDFEEDFKFFNPYKIRLGPLISLFNPSFSSAQIAFLESEFHDDDVKNSFLYFQRGKKELQEEEVNQPRLFLALNYAQMKTNHQLHKYPPYTKFAMKSRTDASQPDHHGGLLGLLWALFGPNQLKNKTERFIYKLEHGEYKDFPTCPLPGRDGADPKKFAKALRSNISKPDTTSYGKTPTSPQPPKNSLTGNVLCCRSADAVVVSVGNSKYR